MFDSCQIAWSENSPPTPLRNRKPFRVGLERDLSKFFQLFSNGLRQQILQHVLAWCLEPQQKFQFVNNFTFAPAWNLRNWPEIYMTTKLSGCIILDCIRYFENFN